MKSSNLEQWLFNLVDDTANKSIGPYNKDKPIKDRLWLGLDLDQRSFWGRDCSRLCHRKLEVDLRIAASSFCLWRFSSKLGCRLNSQNLGLRCKFWLCQYELPQGSKFSPFSSPFNLCSGIWHVRYRASLACSDDSNEAAPYRNRTFLYWLATQSLIWLADYETDFASRVVQPIKPSCHSC